MSASTSFDLIAAFKSAAKIDYTKKDNCLAYLHRYAICHAALVAEAVTDIFESPSSSILTSKLDKKKLNVMFVGGGPGNDFVGFLTALNGRCDRLFDLDVIIVDKMSGWEDIFTETVKELRKGEGSYEKVGSIFDEVNVIPTFIKADLSEYGVWTAEMKNKVETADILFLVKALSHIPHTQKLLALQNIVGCLKGALLVYMDYPYPHPVFSLVSSHLKEVYTSWKDKYLLKSQYSGLFGCSNIATCKANVKVFERYQRSFKMNYKKDPEPMEWEDALVEEPMDWLQAEEPMEWEETPLEVSQPSPTEVSLPVIKSQQPKVPSEGTSMSSKVRPILRARVPVPPKRWSTPTHQSTHGPTSVRAPKLFRLVDGALCSATRTSVGLAAWGCPGTPPRVTRMWASYPSSPSREALGELQPFSAFTSKLCVVEKFFRGCL
ncbi:uncharacterized protein CDAR_389771 [Caerostris darwini]|uniref:Uncharacterized protein n=1 Tax=Caerostris darwini TaxID=1538125 RepID=A0AAV4P1B7_9ARAC|nr:uncharacterized protein CDAR_389771 [Caerostris darwini]